MAASANTCSMLEISICFKFLFGLDQNQFADLAFADVHFMHCASVRDVDANEHFAVDLRQAMVITHPDKVSNCYN